MSLLLDPFDIWAPHPRRPTVHNGIATDAAVETIPSVRRSHLRIVEHRDMAPSDDGNQLSIDYTQPRDTIREKFDAFHEANPQVYEHLVRLAREAKGAGATKLGIGNLWEVLRWDHMMKRFPTKDTDGLRLNNNYRAHYARLIMRCNLDLDGIFDTRNIST